MCDRLNLYVIILIFCGQNNKKKAILNKLSSLSTKTIKLKMFTNLQVNMGSWTKGRADVMTFDICRINYGDNGPNWWRESGVFKQFVREGYTGYYIVYSLHFCSYFRQKIISTWKFVFFHRRKKRSLKEYIPTSVCSCSNGHMWCVKW